MKKNLYIIIIFCIFCLPICNNCAQEVPKELKSKVVTTAKQFAYQEHIHYEKKQLMCKNLVDAFRELKEIKSEISQLLIQDIYLLGSDYETCNRKNTNDGNNEFAGWNEVEEYVHKSIKWKYRHSSCKNFKKDDWVTIFILTKDDNNSCPEAMKLVEPHYHYDYKMRNWE